MVQDASKSHVYMFNAGFTPKHASLPINQSLCLEAAGAIEEGVHSILKSVHQLSLMHGFQNAI